MNTTLLRFCRVRRLVFAALGGLLLTALLLAVAPLAAAQSVNLLIGDGGTSDDIGQATATDAAGNVYVTGSFSGTATIGGTQVISAGGVDIFVARYNASGVLQWVKRAGGSGNDEGNGIAVDASGVYVTGQFENTANFNTPSNPATNNLSSEGLTDIFVAKYNASGTVQWLRRAGGSDFDQGNGIAVDAGEVYVTGYFQGTTDFNTPSSPASNTLVSAGGYDIFVAKYNASGVLQWLRRAGGGSGDFGRGIAVDASGVYVIGDFWGTANFNTPASPASNTLTSVGSNDIFVAKYSTSGTVMWLRRAGGSGYDQGRGIAVDASGVYVTGEFLGTANFNTPSDPASNTLSSVGSQDIFVAKYNVAGVWQWARRGGAGSSDAGYGIAVDASGVYAAGYFNSTANFNTPSDPASNTLASAGGLDIFVAKYTTSGTVVWLRRGGGGGFNTGYGIALGASGVYVTGYFQNTANFNTPSNPASNTLVSAGSADLFLARFTLADPAPTLTGFDATPDPVCVGNVATFTATVGNVTGAYDFTLTNGSSPLSGTATGATFSQTLTANGSGVQTYSLIVSDNNSTTFASTTLTITDLSSFSVASLTACPYGSAYVLTATGCPGGTVRWPNSSTGSTYSTYADSPVSATCTIGSCTATTSATITAKMIWAGTTSSYVTCHGGSDGDMAITWGVRTPPISYTILRNGLPFSTSTTSASQTTFNNVLSAGVYSLNAVDATGCRGIFEIRSPISVTIDEPAALSLTLPANQTVGSGTLVTLTATGCVGNVNWSTGALSTTSISFSPTSTSVISATCVNFSCRLTANTAVTVMPPTIANFRPTAATVCAGNVATFTATVGNVTGSYDFTLTNGSSPLSGTATGATFSQTLTASGSGGAGPPVQTYSLIVSDNNSTTFASTTLNVGSHSDYQALVDLYNSTNGPGWTDRTGWLQGCDPCTGNGGNPWVGVTCSAGRVTEINLILNQLSGSLANSLSALTNLQKLELSGNQLNGSIPTGLSSLTNLQVLELSGNELSGSIPSSFSALTSLQGLFLHNNQLSGSIPNSLSALTNLRMLWLYNNQLSGSIPGSLSALTSLQRLYLHNNQLSGCYPASLTAFCGRTTSFSANTGLPGGGSATSFSALCSSGAGSDAFVAAASASQTTALVGSALSLSVTGGSAATFSWLAPAGTTLGTPTTTSAIAATITTAGVKTFTVTVGFGTSCSSTATVSVTGIPTCVSSFTVDDLGEGADASPGDGICATSGGVCTLRAAMQEVTALNCPGPYTITVGVSGTINLTSVLPDIVDDVTFLGPGAANLTVRRSSGGNYRIFTIPNSNTVSFSGFALTDGRSTADGGGISNRGNLTLTNCVVRNNASTGGNGGGIYNTGQLALINTSVSSNTALWGGGLHSNGGSSTLTSCSLVMNRGLWGGGINNRDHTATLTNCVLQSNTSTTGIGGGGGIVSLRGSSTLTSCSLIANRSGDGGGGIFNDSHTTILSNCLFQSNTALYGGGGISNSGGSSTLTSCSLIANQNGTSGGGFSGINHTARISNSLFQSNTATNNEGGGIVNSGGSSTLTSCSLIANRSGDGGGGISTNNHAVILSNCLVQNNTARYGGGGVSNTGGSSTLTSCSFIANVGNVGGGFYSRDNHTTSISNSLFQSNTTTFGGGGILNSGGSSTLTSCSLVTNQSGGNGGGINNSGSHTATLTNSLIQSNTATSLGGGLYNSGGSSRLTSCSLVANQSGASGGGIGNDNSHMAMLTNCVLLSNTASFGGGIICFGGSSTLLNGSFENNSAGSQGGAVQIGSGTHGLTNVSFRGNSAPTGTVFFLQSGTTQLTNGVLFGNGTPGNAIANGTLQATFSLFEQNTTGLTADPTNLTTAVSPFANPTGTQLNACSPAIDAGSNAAFTALTSLSTDLSGNPRFFNGGTGTPDRIDMGAHEFQGIGGSPVSFSVLGSGTATCAQSPTITLSGSQTGVSYQLQRDGVNTGGAVTGTGAALSFGPQSLSGVYSVLATNTTSSCTALMPTSATVLSNTTAPSLSVTPTSATLTCTIASVTLTASGNATSYLWTGGATSSTLAVNAGGIYSVTATGANGCISTTSVVVSQSAGTPTAGLVASGTITCAQTSVTLTASGGNAYAFSGPSGAVASVGNSATVNAGGLYSVTVTNTATGCSSVTTVTVQSNTASPSVSIAPTSGTLTCAVTSLTLTATSSATALRWTGDSTGATLPVSASGTYSVTATGANGCSAVSNAVTITQEVAAPTLSVTPTSGTLSCAAPSLTLTASTSGTGVRWSTNQTTPSIVVSTSGTYSVTATAANGCTSTTNVTVNTDLGGSSPIPTLSASASVVCAGANVIVVGTVGGSPTGLQWYKDGSPVGGQTSATLALGGVQVAQAGSYVLVVTGGCSVTSTPFVLTVNPLPTVTLSFPTGTTVIGPGTGTATITLPDPLPGGFDLSFGALGAVRYERVMIIDRINGYEIRSVDSSTGRFPITRPGPFTITATDSNGCRNRVQGVITNLPAVGR